ncbi:MAG TPA: response regulator [Terracidiphilus sp.]|jgi:DNA-binding response OmpR family regulator
MTLFHTRLKVLIADDEKLIADTLGLILNQSGFEARTVYSCRDALQVARVFHPDLLVSDILMADANGLEMAIEMRELFPDLCVFLLSGQTATAEMVAKSKAAEMGFEVLVKPVHPHELIRRLGAARMRGSRVA